MNYGLYIHIPYCAARCQYCDFYTSATGCGVPDAYVDSMINDFRRFAPRNESGHPVPPATVYFGGGTPSLLAPSQLHRMLAVFSPIAGAEITLEANPESAMLKKLACFRQAGVNRLSLGIQTTSDTSLKRLGRLHSARQAREVLGNARKAGFANISADIMLALPGYTNREFDDTLQMLQQAGVTHISAYLLKIEPCTPFGRTPPKNLPTPDQAADGYLHAVAALQQAGFPQYEISNFAPPGFESRHNLIYWNCGEWLGLGPSAHSSLNGHRFSFAPDIEAALSGFLQPKEEGPCTASDYIMLRLRLAAGLSERDLYHRFSFCLTQNQKNFLNRLAAKGLAHTTEEGWALTPSGFLVQNSILAQLLE